MTRWYLPAAALAVVVVLLLVQTGGGQPRQPDDKTLQSDTALVQKWSTVGPDETSMAPLKDKLNKTITVHFKDTHVKDMIEELQRNSDMTFVVMTEGLDDMMLTLESPGIRIRDILDWACKSNVSSPGLDWDVQNGAVVIGARPLINYSQMETRSYDISFLLLTHPNYTGSDSGVVLNPEHPVEYPGCTWGPLSTNSLSRDELVNNLKTVIQETIAPKEWVDAGGAHTIKEHGGKLFIRSTPRIHAEIAKLLAYLENTAGLMVQIEAKYLSINTATLDAKVGLGKGGLILDAKAADEFLEKTAKADAGAATLGEARMVCFNGQKIYLNGIRDNVFMASNKSGDGGGTILSNAATGVMLSIFPNLVNDRKNIIVDFSSDFVSDAGMRQVDVPVPGTSQNLKIEMNGNLTGQITPPKPIDKPDTEVKKSDLDGTVQNTGRLILPHQPSASGFLGTVKIDMPTRDIVKFNSSVRIPDGGAVIFSASSKSQTTLTEGSKTIVLFLRVKSYTGN